MTRVLWVPGTFRLTNGLLDDLRAAGNYEGFARAKRYRLVKPGGAHDQYAQHQAAVRTAVAAVARRRSWGGPLARVDVLFYIFGHRRHDPDAWCLPGKAALDGLVDAGVFASDRFAVCRTGGRVFATALDEREARDRLMSEVDVGWCAGIGESGMLVVIADWVS